MALVQHLETEGFVNPGCGLGLHKYKREVQSRRIVLSGKKGAQLTLQGKYCSTEVPSGAWSLDVSMSKQQLAPILQGSAGLVTGGPLSLLQAYRTLVAAEHCGGAWCQA